MAGQSRRVSRVHQRRASVWGGPHRPASAVSTHGHLCTCEREERRSSRRSRKAHRPKPGSAQCRLPPPPGAMSQLFDPASPGQGLTPTGPPQASRRQTARSLRAIPEAAPSSSHCLALELPRPTARAHAHRYERSTNSSPATCYPASLERRIPNLGATLRRQISLSPTTAGKHLPRTFFSV